MANSQLLLLEDVDCLGRSGDIVDVRPGFARNFLVPQGVALPATKQALRRQKQLQEERLKKAAEDKKSAEALAKKLEGTVIETRVKVDQEGHMYGSVSVLDIVHMLQEQHGIEMDKRHILLAHPVKNTGVHKIEFKLVEEVPASVTLKVLSETEEATDVVADVEENGSEEAAAE